jgi:hypothetical protein
MSTKVHVDMHKPEVEHAEAAKDGQTRQVHFDGSAGFDKETEDRLTRSLLRKLDTRMLPMLAILFLFSFLDRTNIGNAKVCRACQLHQTPRPCKTDSYRYLDF